MNVSELVLKYIDNLYRQSVDRPQMQYMSPECFEDVVYYFEDLRDYLLDLESPSSEPRSTYADYLLSKGFGVGRFTLKYRQSHPESNCIDENLYSAFSDFLIAYIDCGRKSRDPSEIE